MGLVKTIPHLKRYAAKALVGMSGVLGSLAYNHRTAKAEEKSAPATEFEKFAQKFSPPVEIQKTIEENKGHMPGFGLIEDSQPRIYVKSDDIDRIINAERIKTVIEQHKLSTVEVPNKYIYKVDGIWQVFAEGVDARSLHEKDQGLTLQEVKDLTVIAQETCYCDWHLGNVLRNTENGKLALVDTDDRAFRKITSHCAENLTRYPYSWFRATMNTEAQQWYTDYIKSLPDAEKDVNKVSVTMSSPQLNDSEIDYTKAKKEFRKMTRYVNTLHKLRRELGFRGHYK